MLEQLLHLVKEHAGEAIINNPAIPNEQNNAVISETTTGIFDALKNQVASGGMEGISSLFQNGTQSSTLVTTITQQVSAALVQKFGLSADSAGSVVSGLVPQVMSKVVSKTNDPNDTSFSMDGIISSLSGNAPGMDSIMGAVKGLFGG